MTSSAEVGICCGDHVVVTFQLPLTAEVMVAACSEAAEQTANDQKATAAKRDFVMALSVVPTQGLICSEGVILPGLQTGYVRKGRGDVMRLTFLCGGQMPSGPFVANRHAGWNENVTY